VTDHLTQEHTGGTGQNKGAIQVVVLEEKIMGENDKVAAQVRDQLSRMGIYCINLISSPGSGKTTLLVETLIRIQSKIGCAVIEGDQQTSQDAERIAATGVPVVQVNTLQSCHLNAAHILDSLGRLPLEKTRLLFIENVGNLVCPAGMDLGENEKVVLMSITEGEDKPIKYPLAFNLSEALVITKMDLLPYLRFDLSRCQQYARQVHPGIRIINTSSYQPGGLDEWINYLQKKLLF